MKTINIDGRTLKYEVKHYNSDWGGYDETRFYEGTHTITKRNFWIFGKKIEKVVNSYIFTIGEDIESTSLSRKKCYEKISEKLKSYDKSRNRALEIKNGNLI